MENGQNLECDNEVILTAVGLLKSTDARLVSPEAKGRD